MSQVSFNDWTLVSLSPFPESWKLGITCLLVLAVAMVLWSYRHHRRGWLLSLLRLMGALIVLGLLFEPALQLRAVRQIPSRVAVVIDRSQSMSMASGNATSRQSRVRRLIEEHKDGLEELAQSHVIEWYDLEGPISPSALSTLPAGEKTDLLSGLELAKYANNTKPLAGFVLFSDGSDNSGSWEHHSKQLSKRAIERLHGLDLPVNTVLAVEAEQFRDLSIVDIRSDEFAFIHNTINIDVSLEATGFASLSIPVNLRRGGQIVSSQDALLQPNKRTELSFAIKPDQIGEFIYSVDIPLQSNEALSENNARSFVLQVVRDKIRVLQVAGRPSWDERFLRQHLKENPNVDLVSFFILRTPPDNPRAPESELSLIPFPVDELFTTELETFDVLIFQNFDYRPYNMAQFLPNIRQAVDEGLGFVVMGGDQSFAAGGYQETALEDLIPLSMGPTTMLREKIELDLTDAGHRHPVTQLGRNRQHNTSLWRNLPPFTAFNPSLGIAVGSTALVVNGRQNKKNTPPSPLIAVKELGRGRTMAIATDSMWKWRFADHHSGGAAERAYHRFWSNALHWLVRDPKHSKVRVLPEDRRFESGNPVRISLEVRGLDYLPVPSADLRLSVQRIGGKEITEHSLVTDDKGVLSFDLGDLKPGAYRATAASSPGANGIDSGEAVFIVGTSSPEQNFPAPNPWMLKAMAESSDGRYFTSDQEPWRRLGLSEEKMVEIDRRKNLELWDNAAALILVILLLAAEWALRRRSGYL